MTDQNPPAEEPGTAAPVEVPTGSTAPADGAPAGAPEAEAPTEAAESPTEVAEPPAPAAATDSAVDAGSAPDVAPPADEAPTEAAEIPAAAGVEGAPPDAPTPPVVPVPPAAGAPRERGRGVFVPAWVAIVVGVLVVAGLGFLIGWIAAPDDDSSTTSASATSPNTQQVPTFPTLPNGTGNDGSDDDSQTVPSADTAFMGVGVESATDGGTGARVTTVQADSPAADAGLRAGDVITAIDGEEIETSLDAVRAVRSHDPGDTIEVTYTRDGTSRDVEVTLGSTSTTRAS